MRLDTFSFIKVSVLIIKLEIDQENTQSIEECVIIVMAYLI